MDFGRNIKKRAKQIDKNLDKIVKNPYEIEEVETKSNFQRIKKPLFISLAGLAGCLAIALITNGVAKSLKQMADIDANQLAQLNEANPNEGTIEDGDKNKDGSNSHTHTQPIDYGNNENNGSSNENEGLETNVEQTRTPDLDFSNYAPGDFGFPEFAYFAYFSSLTSQPRMAPKAIPFEGTTENDTRTSYYDENNYLHHPIRYREFYTFDQFFYFEFTSHDCPFLEERIGNGLIQGFTVRSDIIYDYDYILVLKNENKFYSCMLNSGSYKNNLVTMHSYSAHKYIDGWDVVKTPNKIPLTITYRAGYLTAQTISIDGHVFPLKSEDLYYINTQVEVGVNDVRSFIGLDPDGRFLTDYLQIEVQPVVEIKEEDLMTGFTLKEFGDDPFKYVLVDEDGQLTPTIGNSNDVYAIDDRYVDERHCSIFAADVNYDGYRELVYLGKTIKDSDYVIAYDLHNNVKIKEEIKYRGFDVWFDFNDKILSAYGYRYDSETDTEIVYDHADIVGGNTSDTLVLSWQNLYVDEYLALESLTDSEGNDMLYFGDIGRFSNLQVNQTYLVTLRMHYKSNCENPDNINLLDAVFSSCIKDGDNYSWLETTKVDCETKNCYTYAFTITEPGTYGLEFMFSHCKTIIRNVTVS